MARRFYRKTLDGVAIGIQVIVGDAQNKVISYWSGTSPTKSRKGHWRRVSPAHARLRGDIERAFRYRLARLIGD
jgi:hypothetical protein